MKYRQIVPFMLVFLPIWGFAQSDFKTESISIFKNNTAFYIKSGKLKTANKQYRMTDNFPRALFGTFWFFSPNGELKSVSSFQDEVDKKFDANSLTQMLVANQGKKVKLELVGDKQLEGTLVQVNQFGKSSDFGKSICLLQENETGKWVSFKSGEVTQIAFDEKPSLDFKLPQQQSVIQLDFTSAKSEQEMEIMYLQNGLGWLPNYLIELTSENKAKLTLRAELTNDAEDIENTTINFVVGVPNFRYATSPTSLVDFLGGGASYARRSSGNFNNFANSIVTQRRNYESDDDFGFGGGDDWGFSGGSGGGSGLPEVETSSAEDLFFYTLKDISLKKGGRAYYDVLKTEIDIEHIYESFLDANKTSASYYQKSYSFTENKSNKIYHSIKVSNKSASPWTTGSAMVIQVDKSGKKPISQDLLQYTPKGGSSFVKLTETTDVRIKHAEKEIDRESKKVKWKDKYYYDLVQVEGQVKITNHKSKTIRLDLKRDITGEVKKSDEKWQTVERVNLYGNVNKTTDVCWELTLKPGEEKIITYTYEVYVR